MTIVRAGRGEGNRRARGGSKVGTTSCAGTTRRGRTTAAPLAWDNSNELDVRPRPSDARLARHALSRRGGSARARGRRRAVARDPWRVALWEWLPDLGPLAFEIGQAPKKDAPITAQLVTKPREPQAEASRQRRPAAACPTARCNALAEVPAAGAARRTHACATDDFAGASRRPVPTDPAAPIAPPLPAPAITPPVAQEHADLSSYIAAKRRARGESESGPSSPSEDENARVNQIVAANLASINTPTFGADRRNSGGMFQITQLNADSAEFTFYGWNKDIKRRASQRIDVRRGPNGDIRIAVVRKMIAIIREYEQEDFTWRSNRLARDVTLSARAADNEGLEQFMLREFF